MNMANNRTDNNNSAGSIFNGTKRKGFLGGVLLYSSMRRHTSYVSTLSSQRLVGSVVAKYLLKCIELLASKCTWKL